MRPGYRYRGRGLYKRREVAGGIAKMISNRRAVGVARLGRRGTKSRADSYRTDLDQVVTVAAGVVQAAAKVLRAARANVLESIKRDRTGGRY